jgi:hypothetical protein
LRIFPDPQRQSDVKFIFAKGLAYSDRMLIVVCLLAGGILFQLLVDFWGGAFILAIATGLSLIKGYQDKPELIDKEDWAQVTPEEYTKVKLKQKQLERWDIDVFDVTNLLGGGLFIFLTGAAVFVFFYLSVNSFDQLSLYWAIDVVIIFFPHWFTGVREYLRRDKLIVKINLLEKIMAVLAIPSDIQVLPMLATMKTKDNKDVPSDARLMVRFLNAPDHFLGMQVQVSINSVEGTDYPYLYCVLLAKQGSRFFPKGGSSCQNYDEDDIVIEKETSEGVDVLVIRQRTTETSGYYTKFNDCLGLVNTGLAISRSILRP